MAQKLAPCLFVPHGGGPLPLYDVPYQRDIGKFMKTKGREVLIENAVPDAIIVITAHWESTDAVRISSAPRHELLYDYNFPQYPDAYILKYEAPGHPELARRIQEKLKEDGIESILDEERGWDHGTFIPMILIHPKADIPIVQISILANQDTEEHWNIGRVLGQFRRENIAVLGSGMTYHNMYNLRNYLNFSKSIVRNANFDKFVGEVCEADFDERKRLILTWREQGDALESHPEGEAEHLMPWIVAAAAGGNSKCEKVFTADFKLIFS